MIDIEDITARTESTATIQFTGAPAVKARYVDRTFLPGYMRAQYRYVLTGGAGRWVCFRVMTSGHRILKPGPDGAQRLGRNDEERGVDVEERHRHRQRRDGMGEPAAEAVEGALFLLDEFLRLGKAVSRNQRLGRPAVFPGHVAPRKIARRAAGLPAARCLSLEGSRFTGPCGPFP